MSNCRVGKSFIKNVKKHIILNFQISFNIFSLTFYLIIQPATITTEPSFPARNGISHVFAGSFTEYLQLCHDIRICIDYIVPFPRVPAQIVQLQVLDRSCPSP